MARMAQMAQMALAKIGTSPAHATWQNLYAWARDVSTPRPRVSPLDLVGPATKKTNEKEKIGKEGEKKHPRRPTHTPLAPPALRLFTDLAALVPEYLYQARLGLIATFVPWI